MTIHPLKSVRNNGPRRIGVILDTVTIETTRRCIASAVVIQTRFDSYRF